MLSLLLDSSNTNLTVGICKDNVIIYQTSYSCWQRQSELMIPEIQKGLAKCHLYLKDFDEVVVGKGPGSYTGVRISLTIAKIICQMTNAKLIMLSSLQIMGNRDLNFIALMNARSSRSYVGIYSEGKTILEDCIKTNQEVMDLINLYPDFEVIGDLDYLEIKGNKPKEIEGMISFKDSTSPVEDVLSVKPVYLKDNYGI